MELTKNNIKIGMLVSSKEFTSNSPIKIIDIIGGDMQLKFEDDSSGWYSIYSNFYQWQILEPNKVAEKKVYLTAENAKVGMQVLMHGGPSRSGVITKLWKDGSEAAFDIAWDKDFGYGPKSVGYWFSCQSDWVIVGIKSVQFDSTEKPCKHCARPNYVFEKNCWCCQKAL